MAAPHILLTNKKLGWNGEVKIIGELAERLPERGFRVSLATNPKAHLLTRLPANSLTVLPLELQKKKPGIFTALPRDLRRLAEFVRAESVDLIHTHASFDTWTAALAKRLYRLNVPLVRTKHNVKRIRKGLANRWFYGAMDYVVAPSRAVFHDVQDSRLVAEERLKLIPYGIRLDESEIYSGTLPDARAELGLDPNDVIILYLSRLTERKDPYVLARAFLELAKHRDNLRLLYVGPPEPGVLEKLQAVAGDHPRIEYWGQRNDVPTILAASDVFVLPSVTEAFGLAPLEAMRQGLPVVVSDAEGFKDFVENGVNGLMFPAGNQAALKAAIESLLDNPELRARLVNAAHESVQSKFNIDRMVDDYAALYQAILDTSA